MGAGPEVSDLDEQIAQARRDKESAASAEDYERAAQLRDRERQLLAEKSARQAEWAAAHLDLSSLAEGLHRVGDEVEAASRAAPPGRRRSAGRRRVSTYAAAALGPRPQAPGPLSPGEPGGRPHHWQAQR